MRMDQDNSMGTRWLDVKPRHRTVVSEQQNCGASLFSTCTWEGNEKHQRERGDNLENKIKMICAATIPLRTEDRRESAKIGW